MITCHTSGEWRFRQIDDDGLGYIEADGHDIMHAGVLDISPAENIANALLTAAAPDLAKALKTARASINAFYVAMGMTDEGRALNLAYIDAALAKATGK